MSLCTVSGDRLTELENRLVARKEGGGETGGESAVSRLKPVHAVCITPSLCWRPELTQYCKPTAFSKIS